MTYPTEDQHERWKEAAEANGVSLSQYIQDMVEAGQKKFDLTVESDEELQDLRRQRNDLRNELAHARDRINQLERQAHTTERDHIVQFIEDNPGATLPEIINHLIQNTDSRVAGHLTALVGERVREDDGHYYTLDENQ